VVASRRCDATQWAAPSELRCPRLVDSSHFPGSIHAFSRSGRRSRSASFLAGNRAERGCRSRRREFVGSHRAARDGRSRAVRIRAVRVVRAQIAAFHCSFRDAGSILVGARYEDRGMIVLKAASDDEARAEIARDPMVAAGTFAMTIASFHPFFPGCIP